MNSQFGLDIHKRITQFNLAKEYFGTWAALNHCLALQINDYYHNVYFGAASEYGMRWEFLLTTSKYLKIYPFKYSDAAFHAQCEWDL